MKKIYLAITTLSVLFTACKKNHDASMAGVYKGTLQTFQHGKAGTWIQTDKNGNPVKVGITIDAEAMNSLDTNRPESAGHHHVNSLSLQLPAIPGLSPFTHALLDWNPYGHEPAGVYDKAHFDFHFYTQSEADRMAIPPYEVDSTKFVQFPAQGYLPAVYVPTPGGVPMMGSHWIDVNAGEINGKPFTETFLYGSYAGAVTFYEPMITKAFIDANPSFTRSFPVPVKFKKTGYYPSRYRISREQGSLTITLEDFLYRQGS